MPVVPRQQGPADDLAAALVGRRFDQMSNFYAYVEEEEDANHHDRLVWALLAELDSDVRRFDLEQLCEAQRKIDDALRASPDPSDELLMLFSALCDWTNTYAAAYGEAGFLIGVEVGRRLAGGAR